MPQGSPSLAAPPAAARASAGLEAHFPPGFTWGAATAAYQIEGAVGADGRGESIWDRFCSVPGNVRNGESGAIACDFYTRYPADIELMRELGIDAFRFSVAWPRVLPAGDRTINQAGLDFYDRLVDDLLASGIRPFLTLYHWDLPQTLEEHGGWPERRTVEAFVDYVEIVARRLGDRVLDWVTHNEPSVAASHGYGFGVHAPGRSNQADEFAAAHHMLLSHGHAVEVLRREVPASRIGVAHSMSQTYEASSSEADRAAARRVDGFGNRWYLDALFKGEYPADVLTALADDVPDIRDGDLEVISKPIDFLGINNYFRQVVAAGPTADRPRIVREPHWDLTAMGWEIYPDGLFDLLLRLRDDYTPKSILITENGAAFSDDRGHDGTVRDPERVSYFNDYIEAVGRAIQAGVPVDGYFAWSLLDNFEWAQGYSKRFGLIYVDFHTLERTPKASFYWYRDLVARYRASQTPLDLPSGVTR